MSQDGPLEANIFKAQLAAAIPFDQQQGPANQERDGKFRKIKVELVNPETNEPLRVVDEKGKPIKYQIQAKTGYTAPRPVE